MATNSRGHSQRSSRQKRSSLQQKHTPHSLYMSVPPVNENVDFSFQNIPLSPPPRKSSLSSGGGGRRNSQSLYMSVSPVNENVDFSFQDIPLPPPPKKQSLSSGGGGGRRKSQSRERKSPVRVPSPVRRDSYKGKKPIDLRHVIFPPARYSQTETRSPSKEDKTSKVKISMTDFPDLPDGRLSLDWYPPQSRPVRSHT